ncbi:MAG TPA: glutamyl-tRNA reductase [Polyangiales bacterium]|nr:glutamyl-tRNA reductase [Polyangiales bacterium]
MAPELIMVGVSHHTAPLDVREKLAIAGEELPEVLRALRERGLEEAMLVSTCNRVEMYASAESPLSAVRAVRDYFSERVGGQDIGSHLYEHTGASVARHAFRVAASLDSLVVGEPQILGQVKDAFTVASDTNTVGTLLGRCMTRAFAVAKRVRNETGIATGAVSVSTIACDLAKSIFGELTGRRVLLVGAGEMSEGAAKALAQQGTLLTVVNRNQERARAVAQTCGGEAREWEQLSQELIAADVVITSTASPRPVITRELMQGVIKARRHRPLFLIDIAVPRDVDPRVESMDNVFLYDVDDLQQVASQAMAARRREAEHAERIVEEEVVAFEQWQRSLGLTPTLVALRERVRTVVTAELERTLPRLKSVSASEKKSLEMMADAIVNKLLHTPTTELKKSREQPDGDQLVSSVRKLFALDEAVSAPASPSATLVPAKPQGERT